MLIKTFLISREIIKQPKDPVRIHAIELKRLLKNALLYWSIRFLMSLKERRRIHSPMTPPSMITVTIPKSMLFPLPLFLDFKNKMG